MKKLLLAILIASLSFADAPAMAAASAASLSASRFSVTVEGKGPDLILIPGLMSSRSVWDGAIASLGGKYRIHRLQLAGFAGEPAGANASGALLVPVVDQLAAYIAERKLARPAVVGHSMGGLIGLMLADRHPRLVGKLLIVDALPFYPMLMGPNITAEAVEPRAAQMRDLIAGMGEDAFRAQQAMGLASLVKTAEARPRLLEHSVRSDRSVASRAIYEVMTTDMRSKLASLKAPLTVAYATNAQATDAVVGPLYLSYAAAPGARLVEVPDSYHFIMIDQPQRFHGILKQFLETPEPQ